MENQSVSANNKRAISRKAIASGELGELIFLIWQIDAAEITRQFSKHGVPVYTDSDVERLVSFYRLGLDKKGVKTSDGKTLVFDTSKIMSNVMVTKDDVNRSNINWTN